MIVLLFYLKNYCFCQADEEERVAPVVTRRLSLAQLQAKMPEDLSNDRDYYEASVQYRVRFVVSLFNFFPIDFPFYVINFCLGLGYADYHCG